jgi:endonuclease/exonuclease/phosphatase family metal-dependent hydrolase
MTFNVMCEFCAKDHDSTLSQRLTAVADTINRHNPDLISLQEIRTRGQVNELLSQVKVKYVPLLAESFLVSFGDPTLLVREGRFSVANKDGFWLGPHSPSFSLGWKTSFPRRIEYAVIDDASGGSFIFAGSHFDNNPRNREPSADLLLEHFAKSKIPVLFAGDTNLRPDRPGYARLTTHFRDTFAEVSAHPYVTNHPTVPTDGCNLEKAATFPECRVDHVLVSKGAPWITESWSVDTYAYPAPVGMISDHRAVIVELKR